MEEFLRFLHFHQFPLIEYSDPAAAGAKQVKVVGNEKIGNIFFFLYLFQYPDDLRLYGNIQHRSGFIQNQQPGFQKKKPPEAYTLQFSSGKLMGGSGAKVLLSAGGVSSYHGFPDRGKYPFRVSSPVLPWIP